MRLPIITARSTTGLASSAGLIPTTKLIPTTGLIPTDVGDARSVGRSTIPTTVRGSMLIVAMGILFLMSLMAVTFVSLMTLEKEAAINYVDSVRARYTARAGTTRVLASLKNNLGKPLFNGQTLAPHIFGAAGKTINVRLKVEDVTARNNPFFYGYTGRQYTDNKAPNFASTDGPVGIDEYKVKVIETSALLDMNHPVLRDDVGKALEGEVFEEMLRSLGGAIARSRQTDPITAARFTGRGGQARGVQAILAFRASLDGDRFKSKSQLRQLFGNDSQGDYNYSVLTDYVTVHAWRDVKAVVPNPSNTAHHRVMIAEGGRAQINLNLAPKEVLVAVIAPLAGRRYALMPLSQTREIEGGGASTNYFPSGGASGFLLREETSYEVREGYVYIGPIGVPRAERIADWIIGQRPFLSMAHFHQKLLIESEKTAGALDGALPAANAQDARVFVRRRTGPGATPSTRYNLTGIHQEPWFRDFVRKASYSLLMANFNPAFVSNTHNPNSAAYFPIDKASLVFPKDLSKPNPESTLSNRQTVDACFDSRGIYELTTLGQILGTEGEVKAKEKLFTVVRTFDMMVHRSQPDFETNDLEFAPTGSGAAREGVASFPENITMFKTASAAGRKNQPDPLIAELPWGHLEVDTIPMFGVAGRRPVNRLGVGWGTLLFSAMFDWPVPNQNGAKYLNSQTANQTQIGSALAAETLGFARARGEVVRRARSGNFWATKGIGLVFRDGLYTSHRNGRDLQLWYRAGAQDMNDLAQGALGKGVGPTGDAKQGNIWYRKGGLEFWYKPDFDWGYKGGGGVQPTKLACGYVFASRVYYNPGNPGAQPVPAPLTDSPSDGTQLFVFRNTAGQIRATRLYFRVVGSASSLELPNRLVDPVLGDPYPAAGGPAFVTGGTYVYGGGTGGAIDLYREAAERRPFTPPAGGNPAVLGYIWPPAEMKPDPLILRARSDAFVEFKDLQGWRANEWHHIAVEWDDALADNQLRIYVDGVAPAKRLHGLPSSPSGVDKNMFVRLNEPPRIGSSGKAFPKDQIFVAGIERNLAAKGAGVFKQTNTVEEGLSSAVKPRKIRLYANGTVDDFLVWNLATPSNGSTLTNVNNFGRFEPEGTYVQRFDLSSRFPNGQNPIELAQLSVTALLPTRHGANAPKINGAGAVEISIDLPAGLQLRKPGTQVAQRSMIIDRLNGYMHADIVGANGKPVILTPNVDPRRSQLQYTIIMNPATFSRGTAGTTPQMANIDTPVVQEVGISWFLPVEETLLSERILE